MPCYPGTTINSRGRKRGRCPFPKSAGLLVAPQLYRRRNDGGNSSIRDFLLVRRESAVQRISGGPNLFQFCYAAASVLGGLVDLLQSADGRPFRCRHSNSRSLPGKLTSISAHFLRKRKPRSLLLGRQTQIHFHERKTMFDLFVKVRRGAINRVPLVRWISPTIPSSASRRSSEDSATTAELCKAICCPDREC